MARSGIGPAARHRSKILPLSRLSRALWMVGLIWQPVLAGVLVPVPNASFELPESPYATPIVDAWQHTPKPDWYVEQGSFLWSQLTGVFSNRPPTEPDHIDNCDGKQACWLFAQQEVGLFQDYDSIGGTNTVPSHEFDASYALGKSYSLIVGVIGGGGGMLPGATLEIGLYYRDETSNRVTVAATSITNSLAVFSNTTHLVDFNVATPMVRAGDPWAGKHIGIHLLSTVSTNEARGYWDLDNVRLLESTPPVLTAPVWVDGQFGFTLIGEPGREVAILASTNASEPTTNWPMLMVVTNETGILEVIDPSAVPDRRFYSAHSLP